VPAFDALEAAARQGATELARLATVLGHETDLAAELERVTDTARATGQHVELELHEPAVELDPDVRHTVVCVAAEALTNAAKHAAGAAVRVRLHARPDQLELAVIDSGGVTRDLPGGGHGTASMAQRVKACGGTFNSGPRPDGGWTVQAVLPLSM
jgi:signal transduction histidine kinase